MVLNKQVSDAFGSRVRQTTSRQGSTLIWVMVVVLVMIIALGIGLTAVSGQFNLSSVRHEEHQAYYTALSSTETVAAWITENADGDDPEEAKVIEMLFEKIPSGDTGITIDEAGIPEEAGTCTVNLRWLDADESQLKITSTATFAGVTETVSLTLTRPGFTPSAFEGELKASSFSTDAYDKRANELNILTSDGIVALYEPNDDNNMYFNEGYTGDSKSSNKDMLNTYISSTSKLEARWTNVKLTSSSKSADYHNNVLGTQRNGSYATDWRRFMVPANGRIIIDPLEEDSHEGTSDESNTSATSANNTRIVGLAIHGTAGKNVLFRLASGSAATGTPSNNVFISTKSSNSGKTITNDVTTSATFVAGRSSSRYASLVTLDFTDNAESNATASYTIDGRPEINYTWHPDKWKSMDLFVQSSGQLNTNLVLGPFGHKNNIYMDYKGDGEFRDSYHGQPGTEGEFKTQWPYVSTTRTGLPIFSVDFGRNAGFWILDKSSSKYFRIMQGVNILDGTIYSTRKTIIGGALIRSDSGKTTDGLNRAVFGYANYSPDNNAMYVEATTRFSQLIYNTDIILKAPSSGTAASEIRRPQSWRSRTNFESMEKEARNHDAKYEPTMTIKGGTIYVGERQSLTIQGTAEGWKDVSKTTWVALDNMWISPDKIVVAAGGALTIEKSATTNILTDIYVDGGTLTINAGAKIKGNVYAYNGATVKVEGAFQLDFPTELGRAHDGLLIYGAGTIGAKIRTGEGANDFVEITKAAKLETPAVLAAITGTSSRVHLVGGNWEALVPKTPVTALSGTYAKNFLCEGYDTKPGRVGRCPHYAGNNAGSGGWIVGAYDDS